MTDMLFIVTQLSRFSSLSLQVERLEQDYSIRMSCGYKSDMSWAATLCGADTIDLTGVDPISFNDDWLWLMWADYVEWLPYYEVKQLSVSPPEGCPFEGLLVGAHP